MIWLNISRNLLGALFVQGGWGNVEDYPNILADNGSRVIQILFSGGYTIIFQEDSTLFYVANNIHNGNRLHKKEVVHFDQIQQPADLNKIGEFWCI